MNKNDFERTKSQRRIPIVNKKDKDCQLFLQFKYVIFLNILIF